MTLRVHPHQRRRQPFRGRRLHNRLRPERRAGVTGGKLGLVGIKPWRGKILAFGFKAGFFKLVFEPGAARLVACAAGLLVAEVDITMQIFSDALFIPR